MSEGELKTADLYDIHRQWDAEIGINSTGIL